MSERDVEPRAAPAEARKPWSMAWIAAIVAVFMIAYTYVRIRYARDEPGVLPYEQSQLAAAGPFAAAHPWASVAVETAQTTERIDTSDTLNYLPMASGIPREFGAIVPKDAIWPLMVEAAALQVEPTRLVLRLKLVWPEASAVPTRWTAFSRPAATPETSGGSGGLLAQIRDDLERSIFLSDHILVLPESGSPSTTPAAQTQEITLNLARPENVSAGTRLIIPTRRGLAFLDMPTVP